ncbi:MAG: dihydroneopterin aldolase [Gemmatimonadota bacterium]|jgi:dihydroneopterin aldolase|nr:dihydroneopterin aldolase [Gemmatimonadota bacterium]MDP6529856.1 dihydroneopterin aldolase [Gemmatimonadota bacterium]MDP6802799.1 dihydroneopterin aldolase [Gemmatimonadota bacterium]
MSDLSRITLSGIGLVGHHGYHPAEKEMGQRFEVDVDLFADIEAAAHSDDLADAVNYEEVYAFVEEVVRGDRFSLVEALAVDLAETILDRFPVDGVRIRLRKPSIPFCPNLGCVEIEVERGSIKP